MADAFFLNSSEVDRLRNLMRAYEAGEFTDDPSRPHPDREPIPVYVVQLNEDIAKRSGKCLPKAKASLHGINLDDGCLKKKNVVIDVYNLDCRAYKGGTYLAVFRDPYSGRMIIIYSDCVGSGSGERCCDAFAVTAGCGLVKVGSVLAVDTLTDSVIVQEYVRSVSLCKVGSELCLTTEYATLQLNHNACGVVIGCLLSGFRTECGQIGNCAPGGCCSGSV